MISRSPGADGLDAVLREELARPLYLTPDEVDGGWRELFPELARCLPAPYPIFAIDEEDVVARGFPVMASGGIEQIRREVDRQLAAELEFRLAGELEGGGDKAKVMTQRDRYVRSLAALMGNALLNDYGRGLAEVCLLAHSAELAETLATVPRLARQHDLELGRRLGEEFQFAIAAVFADLVHRGCLRAIDDLKRLSSSGESPGVPSLAAALCQDSLLLAQPRLPAGLRELEPFLRQHLRRDADDLVAGCERAVMALGDLLVRQPTVIRLLEFASGVRLDVGRPEVLLQPRLLEALREAGLAASLGLTPTQLRTLADLGRRLKMAELIGALRARVMPIERRGGQLVLASREPALPIAPTTRPFDFAQPGVVDSSVQRFGLVYDLASFTAVLEEVRKKGRSAEEKALQFMYLFQNRLEEIRGRRRLTFEKFLGDGAFYSARRARPVIAAGCEILLAYDRLRHSGFPFSQGIRLAMNFGTYRLLPLLAEGRDGRVRFEFFGHGIVELARLTTGKSTREIEEIAEFLIHSGFAPSRVDDFLAPLLSARGGRERSTARPYAVWIDARGELVNEGIVLSLPFLEQLDAELVGTPMARLDEAGQRWLVFPADNERPDALSVGLRLLGVARLKGMAPLELAEAAAWETRPAAAVAIENGHPLVSTLRRLEAAGGEGPVADEEAIDIPDNLVVVTFRDGNDRQRWIFGEYRAGDDVLLHAIQVPLRIAEQERSVPLEIWLLRNRSGLGRLYEGLRRETSGASQHLTALRQEKGYSACFLATPHRSPG